MWLSLQLGKFIRKFVSNFSFRMKYDYGCQEKDYIKHRPDKIYHEICSQIPWDKRFNKIPVFCKVGLVKEFTVIVNSRDGITWPRL